MSACLQSLRPRFPRPSWLPLLALLGCAAAVLPCMADTGEAPAPAAASSPARAPRSTNVTINLINRLVERGLLPRADADELIRQAEEDAIEARAQAAATENVARQAAAAVQTVQAAVQQAAPAPVADDTVRVTYVPEVVKAELREQIKQDMMQQARDERWAAPRQYPEWVSRFRFFGDFRFRYDGMFFPVGNVPNDSVGQPVLTNRNFINYNAINTGSPYDMGIATNGTPPPQLDVDAARNRLRLRARLGADIDLGEGFSTGTRFATGENNSPVTQNQSLGAAGNAQGGNFSKYAVWLDRAFLKYQLGGSPESDLAATVGRFDNPFFATSVIWADDLGFDGAVVQVHHALATPGLKGFATAGFFPVFNTDLNFSSVNSTKYRSEDKYLLGGQVGADVKLGHGLGLKLGLAYYDFRRIDGRVSSPFTTWDSSSYPGNTDSSRPAFAQKGNTYIALRDLQFQSYPTTSGTVYSPLFEYFGLATPFRDLAADLKLDWARTENFHVTLTGEFIRNLAFDRNAIENKGPSLFKGPANNVWPQSAADGSGPYTGGDTAWIAGLRVGAAALDRRGDWNVTLNYRHVESDAVVDGFCDSDFGGGGTNLKGWTLGGAVALSSRVWFGARWMNASQAAGQPFKADTLQLDLNARY